MGRQRKANLIYVTPDVMQKYERSRASSSFDDEAFVGYLLQLHQQQMELRVGIRVGETLAKQFSEAEDDMKMNSATLMDHFLSIYESGCGLVKQEPQDEGTYGNVTPQNNPGCGSEVRVRLRISEIRRLRAAPGIAIQTEPQLGTAHVENKNESHIIISSIPKIVQTDRGSQNEEARNNVASSVVIENVSSDTALNSQDDSSFPLYTISRSQSSTESIRVKENRQSSENVSIPGNNTKGEANENGLPYIMIPGIKISQSTGEAQNEQSENCSVSSISVNKEYQSFRDSQGVESVWNSGITATLSSSAEHTTRMRHQTYEEQQQKKRKRDTSPEHPNIPTHLKKKNLTRYQPSWNYEFSWCNRSMKGETYIFCNVCNIHISISSGGRSDLVRHGKSRRHMNKIEQVFTKQTRSTIIAKEAEDPVTKAELLFANFMVENNLKFSVAEPLSNFLFKEMFPDSKIAREFNCGMLKIVEIIHTTLRPKLDENVTTICKQEKFSLLVDGSCEGGEFNSVAIMIRVLDRNVNKIVTRFLALPSGDLRDGENTFNFVNQILQKRKIPWENCVGFACDKLDVIQDKNISLVSRIQHQAPNILDMSSLWHMINSCCEHAISMIPVPIVEFLVDVHFHFYESGRKMGQNQQFREFMMTEPLKILQNCGQSWLSIEPYMKGIFEKWPSLRLYFANHVENGKPGRVRRCADQFRSLEMKLYLSFLIFVFPSLSKFSTIIQQSDEYSVGHMHDEISRQMRTFMSLFLKPNIISSESDIMKVPFRIQANQLPDDSISVGRETLSLMRKMKEESNIFPEQMIHSFIIHVRQFYEEVTWKILQKFPFRDPTLQTLGFLNPKMKDKINAESVAQLALKLNFSKDSEQQLLLDQYQDYQLTPLSDLPAFDPKDIGLDTFWMAMELIQLPSGKPRYAVLVKLAIAALSLPLVYSEVKKSFETVRKIQTEQNGQLELHLIESLISSHMN